MSQNEIAIGIIKKRIQVLERRLWLNKRYGDQRAASEYAAIIRELRYILAEIEQGSNEGSSDNKNKRWGANR